MRTPFTSRLTAGAALVWLCLAAHAPAQAVSVQIATDNHSTRIAADGRELLRYRFGDVPFKPYVSELYTPAGVQILRDAPADHLHHHGLMFGIFIDGVDFWSETSKCGKQQHESMGGVQTSVTGGQTRTHLVEQLAWMAPGSEKPLARETRRLSAHLTGDAEVTLLTWQTQLTPGPGRRSIKLTGTHYDGLGMRLVPSMDGTGRFLYASGEPGPVVRGSERVTKAPWAAYTAPADGKTVTVAMFDHPENARHPAGMFTMLRPFAYLSATPNIWKEPMTLEAGEPLELRYGVAVWDGEVGAESIDRLYKRWVDLAK